MAKQSNKSRTTVLLIGVIVALLALVLVFGFTQLDLGHKLAQLTYKKVSSYEDLAAMANKPGGNYILTQDIDMAGKEWTPFTFSGTLDGNGHSITNLSITSTGSAVRDTYDGNMISYPTALAGFFDVIDGATIRDITFSSVYADIDSDIPVFVGTIGGYMEDAKILNCNVEGELYLRAHDRMFGVAGVVGYGYGTFENVNADVTLVCIDTDRYTKDEQFMGGLMCGGYPDIINCSVKIDGYGSEHGYAHNGGMLGLYMYYPEGNTHHGKMTGNYVEGRIMFFEENDNRRAYCKAMVGETLDEIETFEGNYASFQRLEVYNYDADLLPQERSDVFELTADSEGRFDLKAQYCNDGADATYGLFINGKFYKKVFFPNGEGTVTENIYLEKGKSEIKFRFLPGDGNISISDASLEKSDRSVSLIVAPHEDDEILAYAGMIQKTIAEGNIVKVVFLTNGDYYGTEYASIRLGESVAALESLGVDRSDITVMGYGDMTLEALLTSTDPGQVFKARSGSTDTYGDPSINLFDYHTLNTGNHAAYTGENLVSDFTDYILVCRPDRIYTTSEFEWHTDHVYAFKLVKDTLVKLKETGYKPVLCETVIHGEDTSWPYPLEFNNNTPVITEFTDPFPNTDTTLDWSRVIKIELTDDELQKKMAAIEMFVSQNYGGEEYPGTMDYNYGFCKRDEFYWEISY